MTPSDLRYQASREWMEAEILSGRPVQHRRHTLSVDLDSLDSSQAKRVEAVLDGISIDPDSDRVTVLDSGIDPDREFEIGDNPTAMDEPVIQEVGELPELPEPTQELEPVLVAWETWLSRYCDRALDAIDRLNQDRPDGKGAFGKKVPWGGTRVVFGPGSETAVQPEDGPRAMQRAKAAWLWTWTAQKRFNPQSVAAAKEATTPPIAESNGWIEKLIPEEIAQLFLDQAKRVHGTAKAHEAARRSQVLDFDAEMERWASKHGSTRLQLGLADGYRMNARYLRERIALEAPGFFAMPINSARDQWARRTASPSERALRLRRRVQAAVDQSAPENFDGRPTVEILTVIEPPPQMYLPHEEVSGFEQVRVTDFPSKEGWPWFYDEDGDPYGFKAKPVESVVVKGWLGRFHLIGAVADENGMAPAGIWAVPDLDDFYEDGTVVPKDPDTPDPKAAKRKPPSPGDDDIPF